MTGSSKVRCIGSEPAVRLNAEDGIQRFQHSEQTRDVLRRSGMNDIYIERIHRCTVENGGNSADDDEIHFALGEGLKNRSESPKWHSTLEYAGTR